MYCVLYALHYYSILAQNAAIVSQPLAALHVTPVLLSCSSEVIVISDMTDCDVLLDM